MQIQQLFVITLLGPIVLAQEQRRKSLEGCNNSNKWGVYRSTRVWGVLDAAPWRLRWVSADHTHVRTSRVCGGAAAPPHPPLPRPLRPRIPLPLPVCWTRAQRLPGRGWHDLPPAAPATCRACGSGGDRPRTCPVSHRHARRPHNHTTPTLAHQPPPAPPSPTSHPSTLRSLGITTWRPCRRATPAPTAAVRAAVVTC